MNFNDLYNSLMNEAIREEDHNPLFQQALDILGKLKRTNPKAYHKLMARTNALGDVHKHTPSYKLPPHGHSWIPSLKK